MLYNVKVWGLVQAPKWPLIHDCGAWRALFITPGFFFFLEFFGLPSSFEFAVFGPLLLLFPGPFLPNFV